MQQFSIDLRSQHQRERSDIKPEHESHHCTESAECVVIMRKMSQIPRQAPRRSNPCEYSNQGAGDLILETLLDIGREKINRFHCYDREANNQCPPKVRPQQDNESSDCDTLCEPTAELRPQNGGDQRKKNHHSRKQRKLESRQPSFPERTALRDVRSNIQN